MEEVQSTEVPECSSNADSSPPCVTAECSGNNLQDQKENENPFQCLSLNSKDGISPAEQQSESKTGKENGSVMPSLPRKDQTNVEKPPSVNKISSTSTAARKPFSSQPTVNNPPVVPDFLPGKVNAKLFPPRHFKFEQIEIGSWKYTKEASDFLCASKIKAVFSQRRLIYELHITTDSLQDVMLGSRRMVSVEVPFHTIQGINISENNDVLLEVNSPPAMYLGSQKLNCQTTGHNEKVKYDTSTTVDLTGNQLSTVPYHKISSVRGLKERLREFDPRFGALLQIPIVVDPNKRLAGIGTVPVAKSRKQKTSTVGSTGPSSKKRKPGSCTTTRRNSSSKGDQGSFCSCTTGCTSKRCACNKTTAQCSERCKCVACCNPLNILEEIGADVDDAKRDDCFLQNAGKNLRDLLLGNVTTPCCDEEIPMKDCAVGVVECPDCGAEYRYSWCWNRLCDDECRPRNHCSICRRCGDYRDLHCERCNKCYFAGTAGTFECPCHERRSMGNIAHGLAALWNMLY